MREIEKTGVGLAQGIGQVILYSGYVGPRCDGGHTRKEKKRKRLYARRFSWQKTDQATRRGKSRKYGLAIRYRKDSQ